MGKSSASGERRDPLAVQTTLPASRATRPELPPGARIHQYEIIRLLGEGGMGTVYLARDLRLGRRVAIKLLQADEAEQAQQLLAEARATARCQHENIVVIHEVGEHGGAPYLVLEYLDGRPLAALLEHGQRLPCARAVEIMCSIARALACAHEAGIVHLDLKPGNVVVTEAGTVKVLDFGIARVLQPPDDLTDEGEPDGAIAGTLPYMSPEQWTVGVAIDHRADLWACGILLHQMLCGRHPLPPNRLLTTAALEVPMPSTAESAPPGVPRELIEIVDRCLRKRKEQRWQRAGELLAALEPFLPGRRVSALPLDENPYAGLASFQEVRLARVGPHRVRLGRHHGAALDDVPECRRDGVLRGPSLGRTHRRGRRAHLVAARAGPRPRRDPCSSPEVSYSGGAGA